MVLIKKWSERIKAPEKWRPNSAPPIQSQTGYIREMIFENIKSLHEVHV